MGIGVYARTEHGIDKIVRYIYEPEYENCHVIYFESNATGSRYADKDLPKSSPNIIDLIEAGDYVNGVLVESIYQREEDKLYIHTFDTEIMICFTNNNIKSIVTREMFESMEYKVKE